jgi:nucleoside-triphosphatase THEP1
LIQVLSSIQGDIGGFMVQRVRSGGQVIGYSMVPAKDMDQVWAINPNLPQIVF